MLKKHPLLLSSLLIAAPLNLLAGQNETDSLSASAQEIVSGTQDHHIVANALTPFTGAVSGSKVRLRAQPSLEGHVVRETANGELFVVMGEVQDYYAVQPPKDSKGYVFRTFVLDGVVEGERVNVRLYPDIDAPVVAQLNTGDRITAVVSDVNNKWLEVNLPETSRFFIAKEYIEKKGPLELYATIEKKRSEASHLLSAATLFAQAEIQKPFEQIDLDCINAKFDQISREYQDIPSVITQVKDASSLIHDIYVQKKVAFLEGKNHVHIASQLDSNQMEKLSKYAESKMVGSENHMHEIAAAATKTMGVASTLGSAEITDKMQAWLPLEEACYHMWAASHGEKGIDEFYLEEEGSAMVLTGIVEPYNRPVKNRPGDFLLRSENMPVAFLYSTRINLEKLVGQKITLLAAPRPNHNFAFPAYHVISIE